MEEQLPWTPPSLGKDFSLSVLAVKYWHAARLVIENEPRRSVLMEPTLHLLAHSAELALKQFLTNKITKSQFHKVEKEGKNRHSLLPLTKRCLDEGLLLHIHEITIILLLERAHEAHQFRFGWKDQLATANETVALTHIGHIIDRVTGALGPLRSAYGPGGDQHYTSLPPPPVVTGRITADMIDGIKDAIWKRPPAWQALIQK